MELLAVGPLDFDGHEVHVEMDEAAGVVENVCTAHDVHAAEPLESLYVPDTHAVHKVPSPPVYPALHLQLVILALAGDEMLLLGHCSHVLVMVFSYWAV